MRLYMSGSRKSPMNKVTTMVSNIPKLVVMISAAPPKNDGIFLVNSVARPCGSVPCAECERKFPAA